MKKGATSLLVLYKFDKDYISVWGVFNQAYLRVCYTCIYYFNKYVQQNRKQAPTPNSHNSHHSDRGACLINTQPVQFQQRTYQCSAFAFTSAAHHQNHIPLLLLHGLGHNDGEFSFPKLLSTASSPQITENALPIHHSAETLSIIYTCAYQWESLDISHKMMR